MKEAEKRLNEQKAEAVALLSALTEAVRAYGVNEDKNYSHVGSMGYLLEDLNQLAEFLNAKRYLPKPGDRFVATKLEIVRKPKK